MFFKLLVGISLNFFIWTYVVHCEEEILQAKDSSFEANQTETQTTGSKRALSSSTPYQAPRSVSYPLGDENMVNNDMLSKITSPEANCVEENEFVDYKPECTGPSEGTDELYVACLYSDLNDQATDVDPIYSSPISASNPVPVPEYMCKKCDVQLNPENTGVIVHCYNCYELGNLSWKVDLPTQPPNDNTCSCH